jgi:hypothetical protein
MAIRVNTEVKGTEYAPFVVTDAAYLPHHVVPRRQRAHRRDVDPGETYLCQSRIDIYEKTVEIVCLVRSITVVSL